MMNYNDNENCACDYDMPNLAQIDINQDKCKCGCKFEFEPIEDDVLDDMNKEEMSKKLKCLRFAIIELGLYLDTHPDDKKALCLHKEYTNKFKKLEDQYQKLYGPLSIMYPCNKWRWLEEPWPWERGNN